MSRWRPTWWQHCLPYSRVAARLGVLVVVQLALLYVRVVVMSSGFKMPSQMLSNPLPDIEDVLFRRLTIAYVQALAMSLLVWPVNLCHDYSALEHVTGFGDVRLVVVVMVWLSIASIVAVACARSALPRTIDVWQGRIGVFYPAVAFESAVATDSTDKPTRTGSVTPCATLQAQPPTEASVTDASLPQDSAVSGSCLRFRLLTALVVIALPFLPYSHMLIVVGLVLAERSLFLPSLGACMLVTEVLITVVQHFNDTSASGSSASTTSAACEETTTGTGTGDELKAVGPTRDNAKRTASVDGTTPSRSHSVDRRRAVASRGSNLNVLRSGACGDETGLALAPCQTWTCNWAWYSEETLNQASLKWYPNNPMTLYGLGYVSVSGSAQ